MSSKIGSILFVVAMEAEAAPLIAALSLAPSTALFPPSLPFVAHTGTHGCTSVTVINAGKDTAYSTSVDNVGTLPSGVMTTLALQKQSFDLVINAGTCGGFKRKGAAIGDVFVTSASAFHDRRIDIPGTPFVDYGIGKCSSLPTDKLREALGAKGGVCSTSDSLDHTPSDDAQMLANDAATKDMESAAVHWACKISGDVPHFGVKVVTDIVDGDRPSHEEFMENLGSAATSLQNILPKVLEFVEGRSVEELSGINE